MSLKIFHGPEKIPQKIVSSIPNSKVNKIQINSDSHVIVLKLSLSFKSMCEFPIHIRSSQVSAAKDGYSLALVFRTWTQTKKPKKKNNQPKICLFIQWRKCRKSWILKKYSADTYLHLRADSTIQHNMGSQCVCAHTNQTIKLKTTSQTN